MVQRQHQCVTAFIRIYFLGIRLRNMKSIDLLGERLIFKLYNYVCSTIHTFQRKFKLGLSPPQCSDIVNILDCWTTECAINVQNGFVENVVRLLYDCCTIVVWLLYDCCTIVGRLLYDCCTIVVRLLYDRCTIVVLMLQDCSCCRWFNSWVNSCGSPATQSASKG